MLISWTKLTNEQKCLGLELKKLKYSEQSYCNSWVVWKIWDGDVYCYVSGNIYDQILFFTFRTIQGA